MAETTGTAERSTLLTEPAELRDAAEDLRRQAARLDEVRTDMARELRPESFVDKWEGKVAEGFLRHVNGRYRQSHLDVAHERLSRLARALERAADANQEQIAKNRRLADEVESERARRVVRVGPQTFPEIVPKSARDTRWPQVHRTVMEGAT